MTTVVKQFCSDVRLRTGSSQNLQVHDNGIKKKKQSEHSRTDVPHKPNFNSIVCHTLSFSNTNRDLHSLSERTGQPAQETAYLARDRLAANSTRCRTIFLYLGDYLLWSSLPPSSVFTGREEERSHGVVRPNLYKVGLS